MFTLYRSDRSNVNGQGVLCSRSTLIYMPLYVELLLYIGYCLGKQYLV